MIENAAHALSFRRRRNHIIRFLLRRNDNKWGMTKMYNVFHTFHRNVIESTKPREG